MKRKMITGVLIAAVLVSLLFTLSGCDDAAAADLMSGIEAKAVESDVDLSGDGAAAVAGFGVDLFQRGASGEENPLISPLSVLSALAMTANGAREETLAQMEQAFGLSVPELNQYLHAYLRQLPSGDQYRVSLANSIWFKQDDTFSVERDFLQTNADYYGASIYQAPFDQSTLQAINAWVGEHTDGMIENILDQIPENAVMYLINALAFDAEWQHIYNEQQVRDGSFTAASGETRQVEMMYGDEYAYLDDGKATGFIKYYADRQYAFAALLPNQGVSLDEYIASLSGAGLLATLGRAQEVEVQTAIPKFSSEYALEMSDILIAMGISDAFDAGLADFTGLGASQNGNIFISRVLHKTFIAVDERGTRAGAATVVEMDETAAPAELKSVYLDRPFVYLLIDCATNLPLFIGAVTDIGV